MTLELTILLRVRVRLLPLLLFLLHPPTRAARPQPPAPQTLTLTVAGTALSSRRPSARSLLELLDVSAAPMAVPPPATEAPTDVEIREVWAANLEDEFKLIREVVDRYPCVAMDTEFPGVILKPVGPFRNQNESNYAILESNVNVLKLIQLGLVLSDEKGEFPPCGTRGRACIWQFNFSGFNPLCDPCNGDSIDLLRRSGIDFERFAAEGADTTRFAVLMMSSGVVLNDDVQWITFHSGHDFGYLLRVLTGENMPETLKAFLKLTETFFPVLYDVKHLMQFCGKGGSGLYGGLAKLAEQLGVKRVGTGHQAGSDSLMTLQCFNKLKELYLKDSVKKHAGVLFGLIPEAGGEKTSTSSR
jgi:CCR4-NOT transcription complex subunit 7/8